MKVCSTCSETKELIFFNKRKASSDGLNASCKSCRSARRKTYKSQKEYNKKKYWEDPAKAFQRKEKWYTNNPGKKAEHRKTYRTKNLAKIRLKESLKSVRRRTSVPSWLTPDQKQEIKNFYDLRNDARVITGEEYHVDHIIPLKGKNVCGLHVPWNLQVLPSKVNLSKHNNTGEGGMSGQPQAAGQQ